MDSRLEMYHSESNTLRNVRKSKISITDLYEFLSGKYCQAISSAMGLFWYFLCYSLFY